MTALCFTLIIISLIMFMNGNLISASITYAGACIIASIIELLKDIKKAIGDKK